METLGHLVNIGFVGLVAFALWRAQKNIDDEEQDRKLPKPDPNSQTWQVAEQLRKDVENSVSESVTQLEALRADYERRMRER